MGEDTGLTKPGSDEVLKNPARHVTAGCSDLLPRRVHGRDHSPCPSVGPYECHADAPPRRMWHRCSEPRNGTLPTSVRLIDSYNAKTARHRRGCQHAPEAGRV